MTLRRLYFVYICSSHSCQRLQNTFSKSNAPCVQFLLTPTCHFLNSCCLIGACFHGFLHSSSSSALCSHLSLTVNSNLPYLKMTNFRKALNAKLMFIGLKKFLTNQDRPYISVPEMTKNMQMSTNDNSTNTQRSCLLAANSLLFTLRFLYFLESLCPYFKKYARTSILPNNFHTNTVKYGWAGRSAITTNTSSMNTTNNNTNNSNNHIPSVENPELSIS